MTEPPEIDIAKWTEQAEPFVDDLMKIVNKHMREVTLGPMVFSMARFLASYLEVHAPDPEASKAFQIWAHSLVDAGFVGAREQRAAGDFSKMFATLQ